MNKNSLNIEFLYWEDCPSHSTAWDRLQSVLKEQGLKTQVARIRIQTDEDARQWGFCGSPTIRINGKDIDPIGAEGQHIGLNCRIYYTPEGRITPVPTDKMIREAINTVFKTRR